MRIQRRKKNVIHLSQKVFTPSTLLIPTHKFTFFAMRKQQFKSVNYYFTYLLTTYAKKLNRYLSSNTKENIKWKKQYQNHGLHLQKVCFIPNPSSWEAWRQLSNRYGLSICNLFVIIMELDYLHWVDSGYPNAKPTQPISLENRKTYSLSSKKTQNQKIVSYSFQKIHFSEQTLLRGGFFSLE